MSRIIKCISASFFVVLLLFLCFVPCFAAVPDKSSGVTYRGDPIISGACPVNISLISNDYSPAYLLNPLYSDEMTVDAISSGSSVVDYQDGSFSWDYEYYYFEGDQLRSDIISPNSYFACSYNLTPLSFDNVTYTDLLIEARDFYFYLDPDRTLNLSNSYDDAYSEVVFYLQLDDLFGNAYGTMYYVESGHDSEADYRKEYTYSQDLNSGYSYSLLPIDESLNGQYTEPTLIYVEYVSLRIPLTGNISCTQLSGYYVSFFSNYREIDISSYVEPINPINPGVFRDYTSWIGVATGGFLSLELVDGFTLGGILMTLIGFSIAVWFLKVFAGG